MKRAVLSSVAMIAMMAGAATAQSVSGGLSGGSSMSAGAGESGIETNVGVTANADATMQTGTDAEDEQFKGIMVTSNGALGGTLAADAMNQAVVTADGTTLGTVETVDTSAEGQSRLIVEIAGDLGVGVKRVSIGADAATEMNSETGILLSMTEAEFRSKLDASAGASGETATN